MSSISTPSAGSTGPAARAGALALLLLAVDAPAGELSLRLERSLSEHVPRALEEGTAVLLRFGSSEIEQQIRLTRQRIARLERTNRQLEAALGSGDELASALRTLQGLHDQVQGRVLEAMDSSAIASAASSADKGSDTPAESRVDTLVESPARTSTVTRVDAPVASSAETRVNAPPAVDVTVSSRASVAPDGGAPVDTPAVQTAAPPSQAPAARARIRTPNPPEASGFEIPLAGLPQWVVGAVLGVLILGVLAWIAMRLLARRPDAGDRTPGVPRAADPRGVTRSGKESHTPPLAGSPGSDSTVDPELEADSASGAVEAGTGPGVGPRPLRPSVDSAQDWSATVISRKATDPQALREVDTLIAFEQFDKAKALLDEMLVAEPENPELVLRHYHVRTQGGIDTTDDDEALLKAMMDGPLSDTMTRVRNLGRGLMPGDPLFDDPAKRAAASHVLKESKRNEAGAADADARSDDTVVQFARTVKLDRSPLTGS